MALYPAWRTVERNIGDALPMADHPMMDGSGKEFNLKQLAARTDCSWSSPATLCPFVVGSEGS
ncbi:MAG: hypothetical protein IPL77_21570 [Flavobacteriales bacterium]|nr:hypothetical protein [Flavobacteriales bacterium]